MTSREPNFVNDMEKYGKLGEKVFLDKYSHLDIEDVRDSRFYQDMDVDFVVHYKNRDIMIEVKTDTMAYSTGNLIYEVVAHNSCGWGMITKADYIYEVLIDDCMQVVKTIMLDLKKWKQFIRDRKAPKRINWKQDSDTVNLLCKIDDLRDYGVIVKEK